MTPRTWRQTALLAALWYALMLGAAFGAGRWTARREVATVRALGPSLDELLVAYERALLQLRIVDSFLGTVAAQPAEWPGSVAELVEQASGQ